MSSPEPSQDRVPADRHVGVHGPVRLSEAPVEPQPPALPSWRPSGAAVRRRVVGALSLTWVPLAASLASLVVAVSSIVVATREPEVLLILPEQIRVAQGADFGFAYVYFQPAFVSTGQNDRVEVIRDMRLRIGPAGGTQAVDFQWDEQARLVYDQATKQLNYVYVADAVPLLISPQSAQVPFSVFNGPPGWYFKAGTYRGALAAFRVVASRPLEGSFEFTLSGEDVAFLNRSRGRSFLTFPLTHR